MKLPTEFIRLPFRFDAQRLQQEVDAIEESEWRPHPQGFRGNSALLLVSADGDPGNDALCGHLKPTPLLARLPYIRQVLASFGSKLGRTRLMRIDEHEEVEAHSDLHYYWREHLRIHVPIRTDPAVEFTCGARRLHMAEGECWIFDTWKLHRVTNASGRRRIHLVADMRGSPALWRAIEADPPRAPQWIGFDPARDAEPATEGDSMPVVMSPLEMADHIEALLTDMQASPACPAADTARVGVALHRLRQQWQSLWQRFAATEEGWPHYRALLDQGRRQAATMPASWSLPNGTPASAALSKWIIDAALNPQLARREHLQRFAGRALEQAPAFDAPIFIVAAPRSGSTLLFETLARASDAWTVGGESHALIEGVTSLAPAAHGWESNRLEAADATAPVIEALHRRIGAALRDREGRPWQPGMGPVRLLEKTPKNALRIPFLAAAFPQARFVYLVREPRANVSSILEAWRSGDFVTYEKLPDWKGGRWSLLLIPGWRALQDKSLVDVAMAQYTAAHEAVMADLSALPRERWRAVSHEAWIADPGAQVEHLGDFLGLVFDRPTPRALPPSVVTTTAPDAGKWRRNADALAPHFAAMAQLRLRIADFTGLSVPDADVNAGACASDRAAPMPGSAAATAAADTPVIPPPEAKAPAHARAEADQPAAPSAGPSHDPLDARSMARVRALSSVHTRSFAQVLQTAGISLAVSTYQAGKLVLVRGDGEGVNTNFKEMRKPMGIAFDGARLAVGTANEVQEFQSVPAMAPRLEPPSRVDAAWLPRSIHFTGNIDIHEMAWAGGELWAVNTRFCCLCTFDPASSFVPRWKPSFLSALTPEDRCHLNGMGLRDQQVRYVTLLGRSDVAGGWRERKADGGELIDLQGERVLCEGLSMPHSPRWYRNQLWVLESGNGGLCRVDPVTGRRETVVELPGFTRGLDFHGPLAFVGLSQVRESAVFAKLPLTERLRERTCGIWIVNIEQGRIVAFLRFEDAVQEIFAVTVLPGARYPELVLPGDASVADAFVLPEAALRDVPAARRAAPP